jgi:hypothetical protein
MTKPANIRALEAKLEKALGVAIGAMRELSYARDDEGLPDPRAFYLDCEITAIRKEHFEEMASTIQFMANPDKSPFKAVADAMRASLTKPALYFMMGGAEASPGLRSNSNPVSYGLTSLAEMINCSISGLCPLSAQLTLEISTRQQIVVPNPDAPVGKSDRDRIEGWLKIATTLANDFEMQHVHDRIQIINARLNGKRGVLSHRILADELRVLRETIDDGLKLQLIYRYPTEKRTILMKWKDDWAPVLGAFPSSEQDIIAGVDLWALGHATASIFHFMRVLEHGLRALAIDVGRTYETENWQNIIEQIESEIGKLGDTLPRGISKSERMEFLSKAAKEFSYFKDGWRNHVSHGRGAYDEHQARSILEHVRSFMTVLSAKLGEQHKSARAN